MDIALGYRFENTFAQYGLKILQNNNENIRSKKFLDLFIYDFFK